MLSDLASGGWLKRELCRIHSDTETAETVVDDALKALIVNMSEAGRLDLQTGLQKVLDMFPEGLRVGTACSGTDIAVVGMKHTARALKEVFPEMDLLKVSHLWSCELEEFKNEFIQRNFDVSAVYSDMAVLFCGCSPQPEDCLREADRGHRPLRVRLQLQGLLHAQHRPLVPC